MLHTQQARKCREIIFPHSTISIAMTIKSWHLKRPEESSIENIIIG